MSEHTPGPWKVTVGGAIGALWDGVSHRFGRIVAQVHPMSQDTVEARANARLIAAAPDLLAVAEKEQERVAHMLGCSYCHKYWPPCGVAVRLKRQARKMREAALAKAKGLSTS
jgi:hypothetical protein